MNRYARKRRHKRELKKAYAAVRNVHNIRLDEEQRKEDAAKWFNVRRPHPNGGYEYWRRYYYSGRRRMAKDATNRKVRRRFRREIAGLDPEEVAALRGADYEKEFDYAWTVY